MSVTLTEDQCYEYIMQRYRELGVSTGDQAVAVHDQMMSEIAEINRIRTERHRQNVESMAAGHILVAVLLPVSFVLMLVLLAVIATGPR